MLVLLIAAFAVFLLEVLPIEVTALGLLGILLALGRVDIDQAVTGFSNKAVITVGCMFVISHALVKTGLLEIIADRFGRRLQHRQWLGIAVLLAIVGILSGFLNNTAVVAIFIPLAMDMCRRFQLSPSKVLIPVSYVSIVGGTLTLIGTSTNLLVSALAEQAGEKPLAMFEVSRLGVILLPLGLVYALTIAPRVLPSRAGVSSLTRKYHMGSYLTELRIQPGSKLIGRSCREARLGQDYDVTVLEILRGHGRILERIREVTLRERDILIVRGSFRNVLRLRQDYGVALLSDVKLSEEELASEGTVIAEGLIPPTSSLIGNTLKEIDFRQHFGGFVLALRRRGATLRSRIAQIPLRAADSLLILAPKENLLDLSRSDEVIIVSELDLVLRRHRFWWVVLVLLPLVVLLAAVGAVDITKGALLAVTVLLIVGSVTPREAYRSVDWSVLFLIAAFVPVGHAMTDTGTAQFVASGILFLGELVPDSWGPGIAVSLTYLVTSVLTLMVSNNATALIMVPVGLSMAAVLHADPRPFLIAICFAASAAFMTPMGYQTNMMVYGPGSYRFLDFTRAGTPLNVGFWLLCSFLIPYLW